MTVTRSSDGGAHSLTIAGGVCPTTTTPLSSASCALVHSLASVHRRAQSAEIRRRLEGEMRRARDRSNAIQSAAIASRLIRSNNDFARAAASKERSELLNRERRRRRNNAFAVAEHSGAVAQYRVHTAKRARCRAAVINSSTRAAESIRRQNIAVRRRAAASAALRSGRAAAQSEWRRRSRTALE